MLNAGVENPQECQKLCQLADTCNFFNYGGYNPAKSKQCNLKYGLGRKVTANVPDRRVFGRKYCKGWNFSFFVLQYVYKLLIQLTARWKGFQVALAKRLVGQPMEQES